MLGLAACGLVVFSGLVAAQDNSANRMMSLMDSTFATKAAQGGMAEVQMAQLAEQKTSDPAVKAFAQRMITDHTRLNNELQQIAAKQNITMPTSMDTEDQQMYDRLQNSSSAAFDKTYMPAQVSAHRAAIALFEHEAQHGKNATLMQFASNALPTLREHLRLAEQTESQVKTEK
jgi:putative membrane protein